MLATGAVPTESDQRKTEVAMLSPTGRARVFLFGASVLVLAPFVLGLRHSPADVLRPTSAPSFAGRATPPTRTELLGYARGLDYDTVHGASDTRWLRVEGVEAGRGALMRIDPERGTAALTESDLVHGRIVARVINVGPIPYPELGLPPGDTLYWWIDSTATGWRSLLIPSAENVAVSPRRVRFGSHPGYVWRQSIARFLDGQRSVDYWVVCGIGKCCIVVDG